MRKTGVIKDIAKLKEIPMDIPTAFQVVFLAVQGKPLVTPDICSHQITLGVNEKKRVCVICRSLLEGSDGSAINITGIEVGPYAPMVMMTTEEVEKFKKTIT